MNSLRSQTGDDDGPHDDDGEYVGCYKEKTNTWRAL